VGFLFGVSPTVQLYPAFTIPDYSFKYVLLQGTLIAKNSGIDFKKMPYEEVMDYFRLER